MSENKIEQKKNEFNFKRTDNVLCEINGIEIESFLNLYPIQTIKCKTISQIANT